MADAELGNDILDSRDVEEVLNEILQDAILDIEIEEERDGVTEEEATTWLLSENCPHNEAKRFKGLKALKDEAESLCEWSDGATLIHENHFVDYAKQFAEDIGAISSDVSWPATHIDWDKAAEHLKMDYSTIEVEGNTYYVR